MDTTDEAVVTPLIESLRSEQLNSRRAAIKGLMMLGQIAWPAVPALIDCLKHTDPLLRLESADAIAKIGKRGVPAIIEALKKETDIDHKRSMVITLGMIGYFAKEALPLLQELQKGEELAKEVDEAIKKIQIVPSKILKILPKPFLTWLPVIAFFAVIGTAITTYLSKVFMRAFYDAEWLIIIIGVAWALIGGVIGAFIGEHFWGKRGRFLYATIAIIGGLGSGAIVGGLIGPLVVHLIHALSAGQEQPPPQ